MGEISTIITPSSSPGTSVTSAVVSATVNIP